MADGGYIGENFAELVQSTIGAEMIIAKQSDLKHGQITPQRWVVERSFRTCLESFQEYSQEG
ncbi:hypothetical protein [Lactiplantibacillus plantarum]|uniref:hypothetical protein n=1 Tax=Lactiplantibacillus plantarum TaxID=1590 RepID=UPI0034CD40AB